MRRDRGAADGAAPGQGFTVRAAFCRGTDWLVRATFEADDVKANDWLAYFLRMQHFMGKMFPR